MKLHDYQSDAVRFALEGLSSREGVGLFLDPGMGKTAITLHVLADLMKRGVIRKILIVAPIRVLELVWPKEIAQWGVDLTHVALRGSPERRSQLLREDVDIHMINPDGIRWLAKSAHPEYDCIVIDESTCFANWTAIRTKAMRLLAIKAKKKIILTGTPAANSRKDLFSQVFMLDRGAALGKTLGMFRARYMTQGGYMGREWIMREGMGPIVDKAIAPFCLRLDCKDHLDMPRVLKNVIDVRLSSDTVDLIETLEKELVLGLQNDTISAVHGGALYSKIRQLANGHCKTDEGGTVLVDNAKLDALEGLVDELHGKRLLVAYHFNGDLELMRSRFRDIAVVNGGSDTRSAIRSWKRVLAVQCQAMSHGVDGLQHMCSDICWFGPTDRAEIHTQLNARIYRQGSTSEQIRIHYLQSEDTLDALISKRIQDKDDDQTSMLEYIKLHHHSERRANSDCVPNTGRH
jgi:hypothetical protein